MILSVTATAAIAASFGTADQAEAASYKVKSGDSLWTIAKKYGLSISELKSINKLTNDIIYPNQVLQTGKPAQNSTPSKKSPKKEPVKSNQPNTASTYTIKSGDSLSGIAAKYSMSIKKLMDLNNLTTTLIYPGQKLKVSGSTSSGNASASKPSAPPVSKSDKTSSSASGTYTVKSGDSLSLIASRYGVTVANLKSWNSLRSDMIYVGQKLSIKGASTPKSNSGTGTSPSSNSSGFYIVKSGDSLSLIAKRHGVTVANLKAWNSLRSDMIHVGQKLSIKGTTAPGFNPGTDAGQTSKPNAGTGSYNVSKLIAAAKSQIGVPYVWGGATPSGFDCSGFIYYAYGQAGKQVARTSAEGYFARSAYVTNPQPGDLVFFKNTYKSGISHLGIYLGGGDFIHAGGDRVQISNVSNSYWKQHFDGYKRFY